jgi:hypothetical protein
MQHHGGAGNNLPPFACQEHGVPAGGIHAGLQGQQGVHGMEQRRDRRAEHMYIWKHSTHEAIQNGHLRLIRDSTTDQLADIFQVTKSLQVSLHAACLSGILRKTWTQKS